VHASLGLLGGGSRHGGILDRGELLILGGGGAVGGGGWEPIPFGWVGGGGLSEIWDLAEPAAKLFDW